MPVKTIRKEGSFIFCCIDLISDNLQRMRTFLNEPVSAELDLYKAIASVAQVDNGVALQALFGTEMIHTAVQCFRVDAQIADAKRFKEQAAGFKVVQQITWANAQRCSGDRRIDKIACVRCADRCLGAKVRTPGRAILYHKDLFSAHSYRKQRYPYSAPYRR